MTTADNYEIDLTQAGNYWLRTPEGPRLAQYSPREASVEPGKLVLYTVKDGVGEYPFCDVFGSEEGARE